MKSERPPMPTDTPKPERIWAHNLQHIEDGPRGAYRTGYVREDKFNELRRSRDHCAVEMEKHQEDAVRLRAELDEQAKAIRDRYAPAENEAFRLRAELAEAKRESDLHFANTEDALEALENVQGQLAEARRDSERRLHRVEFCLPLDGDWPNICPDCSGYDPLSEFAKRPHPSAVGHQPRCRVAAACEAEGSKS